MKMRRVKSLFKRQQGKILVLLTLIKIVARPFCFASFRNFFKIIAADFRTGTTHSSSDLVRYILHHTVPFTSTQNRFLPAPWHPQMQDRYNSYTEIALLR